MRNVCWEHIHIGAPAGEVASAMPIVAAAGSLTIEVLHERTAEGAFWGARRFRAIWSDGKHERKADVEARPRSSWASELVVRLEDTGFAWSSKRTARAARALGMALRDEIVRALPAAERAYEVRAKTS